MAMTCVARFPFVCLDGLGENGFQPLGRPRVLDDCLKVGFRLLPDRRAAQHHCALLDLKTGHGLVVDERSDGVATAR